MAEIHHFSYGVVTPLLAYALSVLGSFLGLICTARSGGSRSVGARIWWLSLAAFAIGGTGIWVMHFMAMLGFGVVGGEIRYDVVTTALSAVLAIGTVGVGLLIVGLGDRRAYKIIFAGLITGLGVAAMHYAGMAAMRVEGTIVYDPALVTASIIIAVVAATVALWFTVAVRGGLAIFASALVMGVAVCGMHYTGMAAMAVRAGRSFADPPTGATATALLVPIVVAVVLVVVGLLYATLAGTRDEDEAALAYLRARAAERGAATAPEPARPQPARLTAR